MRVVWGMIFAVLVLFVSASAEAAKYVPPPLDGAVVDTAGKLTADDDRALEARLAAHRAKTGHEVVVFVVGSLGADSVEDVAYGAFNTWHLGKKELDDGVLLVIAPAERKMRIETGKGVGGSLTDIESGIILRERVRPKLEVGDYRGAIDAALDGIEAALAGEPIRSVAAEGPRPRTVLLIIAGAFLGIVVVGGLFAYMIWRFIKSPVTSTSGASSDSSWTSSSSSSSWYSGSSSSSSSSSWDSGGSSFDGGGGSSGGGGASDSW